jgi:hypothetical protein
MFVIEMRDTRTGEVSISDSFRDYFQARLFLECFMPFHIVAKVRKQNDSRSETRTNS